MSVDMWDGIWEDVNEANQPKKRRLVIHGWGIKGVGLL